MSDRCCGCIPSRIGILVWGYINVILGLLWFSATLFFSTILETPTMMCDVPFTKLAHVILGIEIFFVLPALNVMILLFLIFKVHKMLTATAFIALALYIMVGTPLKLVHFKETIYLEQLLFSCKNYWLAILLIIGSHKKCRKLINLYYYAGLISFVENACMVMTSIIDCLIYENNYWPWSRSLCIYLAIIAVLIIYVLNQGYILFLINKKINKYKIDEQTIVPATAPTNEDMLLNILQLENRDQEPEDLAPTSLNATPTVLLHKEVGPNYKLPEERTSLRKGLDEQKSFSVASTALLHNEVGSDKLSEENNSASEGLEAERSLYPNLNLN